MSQRTHRQTLRRRAPKRKSFPGIGTLYDAFAFSNNGPFLLGTAWLGTDDLQGYAQTETQYVVNGVTCAAMPSPVYYGAYYDGVYDSDSLIKFENLNNNTWYKVNAAGWEQHIENGSGGMSYGEIDGRAAFDATGPGS